MFTLLLTLFTGMNILIATSRGGGIKSRMPRNEHRVMSRVYPGARIKTLTSKADKILKNLRCNTRDTHVYIMGGINDVTHKIRGWNYTEVIYTEEPHKTITRIIKDIDDCAEKIKSHGAKPIFSTIAACDIARYNTHMLEDKHWTHTLKHTDKYEDMQTRLEQTVEEVNKYIIHINQSTSTSTPFTHSIVHKRRGKRPHYYKWDYKMLWDGVHGTEKTKQGWAHCISKAIQTNRKRQTQSLDTDTDEESKSPKRSWKVERRFNFN